MRHAKWAAFWVMVGTAALGSGGSAEAEGWAPQLRTGKQAGETVRVYTDGERCVGGVIADVSRCRMQVTLLGRSRPGYEDYRGRYGGVEQDASGRRTSTGVWNFPARDPAQEMLLTLPAPDSRQHRALAVELGRPETAPTLRCGWSLGDVTLRRRGRTQPLRLGDPVAAGDTVATGSESAAIVVLGDRSVAVMQADTTLVLPTGTFNSGDGIERVRVQGGKIWFAVRKLGGGQKFEVETGQAVAAVRGTEFVVEVDPAGDSVMMTDGTVAMSLPGAGGAVIPVTQGRRWDQPAGGVPQVGGFNVRPVVEEWAPLLEIADHCWPFRFDERVPFWTNVVPRNAPINFQRVPPGLLAIAALVQQLNAPLPQLNAPLPQPNGPGGAGPAGGGQGNGGNAGGGQGAGGGQPGRVRVQANGNDDDEDDNDRRGRGKKKRGNGVGRAVGGLVIGGILGGLGGRGGRRYKD